MLVDWEFTDIRRGRRASGLLLSGNGGIGVRRAV